MDIELSNELTAMGPPPSTIRVSLTGKKVQRILLTVSIVLFVCWYATYSYEVRLSQVEHPDHQFNKQVGIAKHLFFAVAVLILILFFYDVYVVYPWYRRDVLRRAQIRMALRPSRQTTFHEAGPADDRLAQWERGPQPFDLNPNHPLVIHTKDIREGLLAMTRQKDTLQDASLPPHQVGPGRQMNYEQFDEWRMEYMADDV